ncbi:MAG: DUF6273 domain-containing protein [Lachnospiraceae bacterium]|nr:DUF6273 domain-containing protein [Lachnospiraceae bacterium]
MKKRNIDSGLASLGKPKMSNRRKLAAVCSAVIAAAMLIGGTLAWTSIFQAADNIIVGEREPYDPGNPGGRLHDDFDGENKDVYAENFGDVPIMVRIRLHETLIVDGTTIVNNSPNIPSQHVCPIHSECACNRGDLPIPAPGLPGSGNAAVRPYFTWVMGGEKAHMPTNNRDSDCLASNTSGEGVDQVTNGQTAPSRWVPEVDGSGNIIGFEEVENDGSHDFWTAGETTFAVNPATITVAWVGGIFNPSLVPDELILTARATLSPMADIPNGGVITMQEWRLLPANQQVGDFWVVDADGWAYWANLLQPGESTSLLLDRVNAVNSPDGDIWIYTITPIAEFSTRTSWHDNGEGQTWFDSPHGAPSRVAVDLIARATAHVVNPAGTVLRSYPLADQNQAPVALGNGFYWNPTTQLVIFGQYWQDTASAEAGVARTPAMRSDLEWFLLDIVDGEALLITRFGVEPVRFNEWNGDLVYATSNLRNWLNSTGIRQATNVNGNHDGFWSTAFTSAEQGRVAVAPTSRFHDTPVRRDMPDWQYGPVSVPVGDRVFALSSSELFEFFGRNTHPGFIRYEMSNAMTRASDYAIALGGLSHTAEGRFWYGNTSYWTRTRRISDRHGVLKAADGNISPNWHIYFADVSARPAVWVSLNP